MDLQKEREAFEKYCFEVLLMSPSDGHFERELEDPEFYESVDTHRLWKLWQAQAIPEGFVLVPKEPTIRMVQLGEHDYRMQPIGFCDVASIYTAMINEAQEQK